MYVDKAHHIHFYNSPSRELYVTEFGHSSLTENRRVGPYVRDVWLLHFVIRDVCHFCSYEVGPGEAFLIAKGQVHSLNVKAGYEHYWFAFDGMGAASLSALFPLEMSGHQHLRLGIERHQLETVLAEGFEQAHGPLGERRAAAVLLALLAFLSPLKEQTAAEGYVQAACAYMEHNYHRRLTMDEVARSISLSEKYLCRLFKRELDRTPVQYLMALRMKKALFLLESTEMLVKDVALTVGYSSQLAFSSAFSGYWGLSPTAVREKNAQ